MTILCEIFLCICHIHAECERYLRIFCGIQSVPHNNVMDLNIFFVELVFVDFSY